MAIELKERRHAQAMSDRQLVSAVRHDDDRAFEQLFSRYRRRISSYVYGLVGEYARAEDITQEVFISALRRLRETEAEIAFRPWIYEIARNACIDEYRRSRRASVVSLEEDAADAGSPVPRLPDETSPEGRWERKEQLGHLRGAFSGLSVNHHRVLVMRELEGLSYGEIGKRLGMSRPVVESTLFRARRRLTYEYDELSSGRRCEDVRAAVDGHEVRALASLGIRERRRIASHLDYCHDCLRYAKAAGVDGSALERPGLARRVAALLPFGWLRVPMRKATRLAARHSGAGAAAARNAQNSIALVDGGAPTMAAGRAIAAAAALMIAGGTLPGLGGAKSDPAPAHPGTQARAAAVLPPPTAAASRTPAATLARSGASSPPLAAAVPASVAAPARTHGSGSPRTARRAPAGAHTHAAAHSAPRQSSSGPASPSAHPPGASHASAGSAPAQTSRAPSHPRPVTSAVAAGSGAVKTVGASVSQTAAAVVKQVPVVGGQAAGAVSTVTTVVSQTAGSAVQQTGDAAGAAVQQTTQAAGTAVQQTGAAAAGAAQSLLSNHATP